MISLQSYVGGRWVACTGDAKTLHDPATEAVLGDVRPGGVDFAAVLERDLPLTPKERFVALYGVKKVWTMHELAPYVRDIVEPGKKADTLVLQFSRRVVAMDLSETFVSRW